MDFPRGAENRFDVLAGEEVRRAVRAIHDADNPLMGVPRNGALWRRAGFGEFAIPVPSQDVAGAQCASRMAAEFAKNEGRSAVEVRGNINPAMDSNIRPSAFGRRAKTQCGSASYMDSLPDRNELAVEPRAHVRSSDRDDRIGMEMQRRTVHRALERGGGLGISSQPVCEAEGQRIHGP